MRKLIALWLPLFYLVSSLSASSFEEGFFEDRAKTMVYVEYFVQMEVDRQPNEGVGLVVSEDGLIVCLENSFPAWIPPSRFKDIKIHTAYNKAKSSFTATYLGQDSVNRWHYLKINEAEAMEHLTPISRFAMAQPRVGDEVWGFGITNREMDYLPYFQDGRLSAVQNLPLPTAFTTNEIAVPGGPVFNFEGYFVGWSQPSFPLDRDIWIGGEYYQANFRNPDESFMFLMAEPFMSSVGKCIPDNPTEGVRGWLGIVGSQPLDIDTAEFLGLDDQGAIVVSEVLAGSPAHDAGLKDRDIILGINDKAFPRFRPVSVVLSYFEREMLKKVAGDKVSIQVLRGQETLLLEATLEKGPKQMKAASITYIPEFGFSIREFLFGDAVNRRVDPNDLKGVVVSFVKRNSPAASAELSITDWILEINGTPIKSIDQGITLLNDEATKGQEELILLVRRGNETSVIRIQNED